MVSRVDDEVVRRGFKTGVKGSDSVRLDGVVCVPLVTWTTIYQLLNLLRGLLLKVGLLTANVQESFDVGGALL